MPQRAQTRLLEKIPRVEDVVSFRFERPSGYTFKAGQWMVVTFPRAGEGDETEPHTHHFSHSSSPLDSTLEVTTRLRGTEFKNALADLPNGAEVELEGPYGSFTLAPGLERVAFLTGGIGITCVRSILRWLGQISGKAEEILGQEAASTSGSPSLPGEVVLLFANRSEESIAFRDELDDLGRRLPYLRVIHVLSRPEQAWAGYQGHIDDAVLDRELPEPDAWSYYLCGPPSLVAAMRELLSRRKISGDSMRMERFDGYE